jgi:hypothetical protein
MDYHPQQLLKVSDLQKELCVSRATAYRMTKYLPMVRVGSGLRISRADLQTFLQVHEGEIPTSEVQAIKVAKRAVKNNPDLYAKRKNRDRGDAR